jgi:hypothetical protein
MLLFSDHVPPGYEKAFAGPGDFQVGLIARPDGIRFTDIPPKTRSGRIMPHLLREIASGTSARGDTTTLDDASVLEGLRIAWRARSGQPRQARARRPLVLHLAFGTWEFANGPSPHEGRSTPIMRTRQSLVERRNPR